MSKSSPLVKFKLQVTPATAHVSGMFLTSHYVLQVHP